MYISRLVTAPAIEPLTLKQAKEHLRLASTLDDSYCETLITAARQYTEKVTGRALLNQTWEVVLPGFPCWDYITLPRNPVVSITSLTYLDAAGVSTVAPTTLYEVDTQSRRGRLVLKDGQSWPSTRGRWNDVEVRYVAGYGATAETVPVPLVQALKLLVAQMYEQRVPEVTGTIVAKVGFAYDALINLYRLRPV